jgi:cysteinyl-tRNA synthetase
MAIRINDSLRRATVPLSTRDEGRVAMYSCGPTVYNYIHIGNARTLLWFGFIRRYLKYRGYEVNYVTNYTDVDDKIIERARLEKLPTEAITRKYTEAYEADMRALGVDPPDVTCRATDHISDMVEAIEGLIERGVAYEVEGDVFFSVESFEGYGKLSGRTLEQMRAGERVEPHPGKKHPLDFALWKSAKENEPSWPSPWGPGRPGWHIECSVMATKYLGTSFDIHGGGSDLTFPHHENEIAQAEALTGEDFARHWMHSGMVQMETEKMSKSLGNFVLAKDVVERFGGPQTRYWALTGSYSTQASFSEDSLRDAALAYERWETFATSAPHALGETPLEVDRARPLDADGDLSEGPIRDFIEAMDDDFNSASALAVIHDLVREGNRRIEGAQQGVADDVEALTGLFHNFLELTGVLGFDFSTQQPAGGGELTPELLDLLLELREEARSDKAFARSDLIRDRLEELGVSVEDTAAGPRWRVGPRP